MITMHIYGLGGIICYLHCWNFDMCLKDNGQWCMAIKLHRRPHVQL